MIAIPYNVLVYLEVSPGDPPVFLTTGEIVPLYSPHHRFREKARIDVEKSLSSLTVIAARRCGLDPRKGKPISAEMTEGGLVLTTDERTAFCGSTRRSQDEDDDEIYLEAPDITPEMSVPHAIAVFLVQAARFDRCAHDLRRTRKSTEPPLVRIERIEKAHGLSVLDVQVI